MASAQASPVLRFLRKLTTSAISDDAPDAQLLARFLRARDEAAFAALVRRHGPMVLAVCRRILRDPHDADDAFQATFLVLVRKAGSVGRPELLGNWLYGVAYRTALKARVAAARRHARERQLMDTPAPSSDSEAVWSDVRPVLDEELNRLPQKYRVPVVLCYFEGKTHEEAARCLGCPRETVSTRLLRARERLRARLTRRGLALSGGLLAAVLAQKAAPAAEVPAGLLGNTIHAATRFAAGQAAAGAAGAPAALAEGVLQAMFWNQLTRVAALLVAALVLGTGGAILTYRVAATEPGQAKDAAPAKPGAKEPAKAADDQEKLQGTWVGVEGERAGEKVPADDKEIKQLRLTIKGDRITFNPDGENRVSVFKLDATQKPKAIDLTPQDGPTKGKTIRGIYSLEGDTLKLCFDHAGHINERPTEFTTKAGTSLVLIVLRRQADDKGKDKPPAKSADDKEKLQGTWVGVEAERAGEKLPAGDIATLKVIIEGNRITANADGEKKEATFKLDPTQKPKAMDVIPQDGAEKDKTIAAIYSLEGDTLKLCFEDAGDQPRPTEFATKTGGRLALYVLRRQADDKGKEKPPAKEAAKAPDDKEKLQGTWVWVEAERGGKKAGDEEIKDFKLVFRGGKVTIDPGGDNLEGTFKLDPSQKPKAIDLMPQNGSEKGKTIRGIYSLEGDTLKLCMSDPDKERPTEFATKAGTELVVIVLRRQADDAGKEKPPVKEPPEAAAERQKLQGTWAAVSGETDGQPVPEDSLKQVHVIIKGDEIHFKPNRTENKVTFTLDPTKKPKLLSMTAQDGPDKGKTVPVIYELAGDRLKLCFDTKAGEKEPTEFVTKPGSGLLLFVLKREDPSKMTDREKLKGTWQAVSGEKNGQPVADNLIQNYKVTFTGDKIKLSTIDESGEGTYTLDPAKKPKTIDITIKENEKAIGIYELDGDTLKLCMTEDKDGNARPTEFAGKDKAILLVFKRQPTEPKPPESEKK